MKIALTEEIRHIDKMAADIYGIDTLLLMEKTDGPVCSGFTVGEVREEFVKSFMTRGIDPVSVGINNPDIWELLKDKYFDPKPFAEKADQYFETALPIAENRDRIKQRVRQVVCRQLILQ